MTEVREMTRSERTKRNVVALLLRKGLGVGISVLLVPLTLKYLGSVEYGVWLTLTSIISWMYFFDLGLGNGMRNKVAEALARDEREKVRVYVSTSYALIAIITAVLIVVFLLLYTHIDWARILQTPAELNADVGVLVLVVYTFFCLQFFFGLISTLLTADQRPATAGYLSTIGSALSLLVVYVLSLQQQGSILWMALLFGLANLLPLIGASVWFFRTRYREYRPSMKHVDFSQSRGLLSLGVKFFLLQAAAIIIYSTNNMIITQLFGPHEVTVYGIAFKYLSVVTMVFSIVLTPFWSAFTDAYHRGDHDWINRMMNRLMWSWCGLFALVAFMVFVSAQVYNVWIGDDISIPFALTITMGVYVLLNAWNSIFSAFQNGIGILRLQLVGAAIGSVTSIPLAILFASTLKFGVKGVLFGAIFGSVLPAIWSPIQFRKIMNGTASGIWVK
ncbi:MAG TPA: MATE family efflux transporter [Bacteroidota bacterium]|nr:MATE family efflux transporter [Bacteroidota bacterium]